MPRPREFELVRTVLARRRELGESFEIAWPKAIAALPADLEERAAALSALKETKGAWQGCYERRSAA